MTLLVVALNAPQKPRVIFLFTLVEADKVTKAVLKEEFVTQSLQCFSTLNLSLHPQPLNL